MKHLILSLFITLTSCAFSAKILVSTSEQDAVIYANGQQVGTGTAIVVVPKNGKTFVQVKKVGYLVAEHIFYSQKNMAKPPKTFYFQLTQDDAFVASEVNDKANIDFSVVISKKMNETEAWKLAVNIVTDYFDVIEVSDKETSYLRTAWQSQSFSQNAIRTRVILKSGGDNVFKIKLISEQSGKAGTSVKSDEEFKEWDRVLRKYNNLIGDFQNRLSDN